MVKVVLRERENLDEVLRKFKRECEKSGIVQELKKRRFYESPSVKKKKKLQELKRKFRRKTQPRVVRKRK